MEIRVLGPSELRDGCVRTEVAAGKQRALLALLVLSLNRVVRRDWLLEELWCGSPPRLAKASLQSCVYRLRRLLQRDGEDARNDGRVALLTRDDGYLLEAPPDCVDLYRFRQLVEQASAALTRGEPEAAVGLFRDCLRQWRGNAFADVEVGAVRSAADTLEDQRLDMVELCLSAELDLGRHEAVVAELEALVNRQPLRERAWALLMTALYRCGRRSEALETYRRLDGLLADRLGIEPTRELRELHQQILDALPVTANVWHLVPPHQLPPDLEPFTGRDSDVAVLDALLPADDLSIHRPTVIAAIDGTAGVGKTALAVHWAHRVKTRFPDGQLYLDLRGFGPTSAMDPAEAAGMMLRSLGVPSEQIVSAGLDGRSARLRTELAGRRMLVLLDNARDASQVRPLLPGSGCMVLVTSRSQLRGLVAREGARRHTLAHFTESDSIDLLVRILGDRALAAPVAARELARMCCGLPLALALAGEWATRAATSRLADLLDDLCSGRDRLDAWGNDEDPASDLRGVFAWSYRSLSPESASLFRLLGVAPGPDISVPAAAALAGIGSSQAQRLLDHLAQANLVRCRRADLFEIHDLLRAYASELAHEHEVNRFAAGRV